MTTSSFCPRPLISLQSPYAWIVQIEERYGWGSETEKLTGQCDMRVPSVQYYKTYQECLSTKHYPSTPAIVIALKQH